MSGCHVDAVEQDFSKNCRNHTILALVFGFELYTYHPLVLSCHLFIPLGKGAPRDKDCSRERAKNICVHLTKCCMMPSKFDLDDRQETPAHILESLTFLDGRRRFMASIQAVSMYVGQAATHGLEESAVNHA